MLEGTCPYCKVYNLFKPDREKDTYPTGDARYWWCKQCGVRVDVEDMPDAKWAVIAYPISMA